MACKNTTCKFHDATSPNGCKLFPGRSWTNCRSSSAKLIVANQTKNTQKKGK